MSENWSVAWASAIPGLWILLAGYCGRSSYRPCRRQLTYLTSEESNVVLYAYKGRAPFLQGPLVGDQDYIDIPGRLR